MKKHVASLSLDLDNKWSYLKTHGDDGWQQFPSYLDLVVPRFLKIFDDRNIDITVFVVGQDAALEKNHRVLSSLAQAGHEIGNHSFNHDPWLHLYDQQQLNDEFKSSEAAIKKATGQQTIGFRGPGFSISDDVIRLLADRNYEYDATVFPTFLGPVARAYYFLRSNLTRAEKQQRKALFGRFTDGFRPNKPFLWNLADHNLVEVPVTTMPVSKLPIHLSYILYLSKFSQAASRLYFWKAIKTCRLFGVQPSILLHPLDFMGQEDDADLSFFPAMDLPVEYKLKTVNFVLDALQNNFELITMRRHAQLALEQKVARRDVSLVRPAAS